MEMALHKQDLKCALHLNVAAFCLHQQVFLPHFEIKAVQFAQHRCFVPQEQNTETC